MSNNDLERMRIEYERRNTDSANTKKYSNFNPSYLFSIQQRQRHLLAQLRQYPAFSFAEKTILDVGCGNGRVMAEYISYGVHSRRVYGIDIQPDRLRNAKDIVPLSKLAYADGQKLPYKSDMFDVVMQYTAFSSILDSSVKVNMAAEILRVLNKDNGMIIWYDFWLSPRNKQTKGIRLDELRDLFPGCTFDVRRVTLAPPIARRVVPMSWLGGHFLESLKIFNSHLLVIIRPR